MYLNCHTHFSFKYGTMSPLTLFDEAQRCGVHKLVITDINNTAGYIEMLRICQENKDRHHLELALGIEFRRDGQPLYIGLAQNNQGFENLNRYLSYHNSNDIPLLRSAPDLESVFFIYPWDQRPAPEKLRANEFVGVAHWNVNSIITSAYHHHQEKLVALRPVTFKDKSGFNVHRLLRAIDGNTLLSKLAPEEQANSQELMIPLESIKSYYQNYPLALTNAETLLNQCEISFELHTDKNKASFTKSRLDDLALLAKLSEKGFEPRFRNKPYYQEAKKRLYRELEIIDQRDFAAYFLICHDIIRFAQSKQFEHVGRGSGANSIVAFCLGLTNVDPIELDLYFERFLNPERSSPPDFDIDFSWKDRDEVTNYIFDRYHSYHTALLGTHTTFKGRSVLRELGKVFGLPKSEIDAIVDYPQQNRNKDHITKLIFKYAQRMLNLPSHLSIHAGGILITEKSIHAYTATDLPPKGFPTAHFEMHNAEDMGIFKLDILSQRGLGHIKDTVAIVKQNQGRAIDPKRFDDFKKDPKIRELLRQGKTMGCFYVESPAMRMLLGKLQCEDYITLVAASSIIRPGVARSGMMRTYIERHHTVNNGGTYESIHPKMDELMAETYGVMVYQEDVIKVAHHFAGLTLAEADILRRGMSGKFRSRKEFKRVEDQFFKNCKERGYEDHVTARVWYEIESFSGYSFSKGHSASYAVESYQSLYLKAHFPLEFMVGVINNFGGFYKTEFYFHEARMSGATIKAPCVNHSEHLTTIYGSTIYIGFIHLKSLESKLGQAIPEERQKNGAFKNLDNFMRRVPIGLEQLRILIRIGALSFTGKNKRELLWEGYLYFRQPQVKRHNLDLFNEPAKSFELPPLEEYPYEDAFNEFELLGFPLCDPFRLLPQDQHGDSQASQLMQKLGQSVTMIGYLVTTKNTQTKNGKLMQFGTFYDNQGNVFDTTHFPPVAKRFPFRGRGFYEIKGKVVEDFSYPMLEVTEMEKLPMVDRYATSVSV